jgi:hypothetical protein
MLHGGSFALCAFLAKDEGGNNEIASAVTAAAAKINFLIVFIGSSPPGEGPVMWPERFRHATI